MPCASPLTLRAGGGAAHESRSRIAHGWCIQIYTLSLTPAAQQQQEEYDTCRQDADADADTSGSRGTEALRLVG